MLGRCHRSFVRHADRARRGITSVEFALLAPAFFMVLMGLVEMSLMMFTQHVIENASYNATRLAKTGYTDSGMSQYETIKTALHDEMVSMSPLVNADKVTLSSTSYAQLSDIGQPEQGTEGIGQPQEIVVYVISYPWKFFTPMIGDIMGGSDNTVTLFSRIVVRNEPYG